MLRMSATNSLPATVRQDVNEGGEEQCSGERADAAQPANSDGHALSLFLSVAFPAPVRQGFNEEPSEAEQAAAAVPAVKLEHEGMLLFTDVETDFSYCFPCAPDLRIGTLMRRFEARFSSRDRSYVYTALDGTIVNAHDTIAHLGGAEFVQVEATWQEPWLLGNYAPALPQQRWLRKLEYRAISLAKEPDLRNCPRASFRVLAAIQRGLLVTVVHVGLLSPNDLVAGIAAIRAAAPARCEALWRDVFDSVGNSGAPRAGPVADVLRAFSTGGALLRINVPLNRVALALSRLSMSGLFRVYLELWSAHPDECKSFMQRVLEEMRQQEVVLPPAGSAATFNAAKPAGMSVQDVWNAHEAWKLVLREDYERVAALRRTRAQRRAVLRAARAARQVNRLRSETEAGRNATGPTST